MVQQEAAAQCILFIRGIHWTRSSRVSVALSVVCSQSEAATGAQVAGFPTWKVLEADAQGQRLVFQASNSFANPASSRLSLRYVIYQARYQAFINPPLPAHSCRSAMATELISRFRLCHGGFSPKVRFCTDLCGRNRPVSGRKRASSFTLARVRSGSDIIGHFTSGPLPTSVCHSNPQLTPGKRPKDT